MSEPRRGTHGFEVRKRLRTDEERLEKFAGLVQTALRNKCAHYEPLVRSVRVERKPQLLVEMIVPAVDSDEAVSKTRYWTNRAFMAQQRAQPVPSVPFGKAEAQPV